MFSTN